jgi:Type VI secretion system/phage-baseplate injector OB domain
VTHWGKYRGKVISTADPMVSGRLLCSVAALPEMLLNWAMPAVPYASIGQGFFAVPIEGSDVWVEFEQGDPNRPIWSGGYWELGDEPVMPEIDPLAPELVNVLRSKFCTLLFNDAPGEAQGVTVSAVDPVAPVPVTMTMNELGFTITCGDLSFSMNPDIGITLTAGDTTMVLTPENVTVETPTVEVTAEETVSVTSPMTEVEGDVDITGAVEITGDTEITGAVEITGDTEITGAVQIEGETNVVGAVTIEGETNVAGAVTVEGETNVLGAFTVEGDANFLGAQQTEGNCAVAGLIEGIVVPPLL